MLYAEVVEEKVINLIECDESYKETIRALYLTDSATHSYILLSSSHKEQGVYIGWSYIDGVFRPPYHLSQQKELDSSITDTKLKDINIAQHIKSIYSYIDLNTAVLKELINTGVLESSNINLGSFDIKEFLEETANHRNKLQKALEDGRD